MLDHLSELRGYGGIALAMPVLLWQVWRFVVPGLHANEKRWAYPFVGCGLVLFVLGAALAFHTLTPALEFLTEVGGEGLLQQFRPAPYFELITYMMLAFGVGFGPVHARHPVDPDVPLLRGLDPHRDVPGSPIRRPVSDGFDVVGGVDRSQPATAAASSPRRPDVFTSGPPALGLASTSASYGPRGQQQRTPSPRMEEIPLIRNPRWARLLALLLPFALFAAACGDDDDTATETEDPTTEDPAAEGDPASDEGDDLSGTIVISGSSTVEPISIAVAEKFEEVQPDVDVSVDGPGTGDGFERFCRGETDISDASRAIKEEEAALCEENGVEFVELKIGNDGIAILTNEANEDVTCLTLADLYALTGPESQGFDNWSDAQDLADELGSSTDFPDAPLDITGPGEESGTYDSYVELVIEEFNEDRGAEAETRPDYQASADDNVIIQGIQGSDTSLGWVGFAFAEEASGVKEIEVDGGDGCIAPTSETIADSSYPISRPLFIYVNAGKAEENPALAEFVDFYLNDAIGSVSEVGYVDLAEEDLTSTVERWDARTTGAA